MSDLENYLYYKNKQGGVEFCYSLLATKNLIYEKNLLNHRSVVYDGPIWICTTADSNRCCYFKR